MSLRDGQGLGGLLLLMVLYVAGVIATGAGSVLFFAAGRYVLGTICGGACFCMVYLVARAWRWRK